MPAEWAQRIDELARRYHAGEPVREELTAAGYHLVTAMIRQRGWWMTGAEEADLIQEGMIGYVEAMDSWRPERVPLYRSWAAVCVRRQLVTAMITAVRQKHRPLNDALSLDRPTYLSEQDRNPVVLVDTLEATWGNPERYVIHLEEQREAAVLLTGLCQGMSRLEREALIRTSLWGQSYQQAAAAMGTTEKAIDNATQRARLKLRRRREAMSA